MSRIDYKPIKHFIMDIYSKLRQLNDYHPKSSHITSKIEMDYIINTLDLFNCTNDDLTNMRNMCVLMWSSRIEHDKEKSYELMDALQSITAVIDDTKWRRGMEV